MVTAILVVLLFIVALAVVLIASRAGKDYESKRREETRQRNIDKMHEDWLEDFKK